MSDGHNHVYGGCGMECAESAFDIFTGDVRNRPRLSESYRQLARRAFMAGFDARDAEIADRDAQIRILKAGQRSNTEHLLVQLVLRGVLATRFVWICKVCGADLARTDSVAALSVKARCSACGVTIHFSQKDVEVEFVLPETAEGAVTPEEGK